MRSAPERLRDDKRQYAEYLKYLMHINNSVVKQKKPKPGSQKTDEQPETGVPPPDDETAKDPEWLAEDTGLDLRKSFRDGIEFWNRPFIRQVAAILDGDTERNILLKKAETATKGLVFEQYEFSLNRTVEYHAAYRCRKPNIFRTFVTN